MLFKKKLYLFILPIILISSLIHKIFAANVGYPFFWIWDEWGEVYAALQMIVNQTIDPNYYLHGPLPTYIFSLVDILHIFSLLKSSIIDRNLSDLFFKIPSETANIPSINYMKEFFEIKYSSFLLWNRYLVALFGTISCFVVYEIAKRSFNEKTAIVSLLIYSFCPFISFSFANLQPEGLMVSFFLISVYFAILYSEKNSLASLHFSAFSLAAACSVKLNASFLILAILLIIVQKKVFERKIITLILFLILFFIYFIICYPTFIINFGKAFESILIQIRIYYITGMDIEFSFFQMLLFFLKSILKNLSFSIFNSEYWAVLDYAVKYENILKRMSDFFQIILIIGFLFIRTNIKNPIQNIIIFISIFFLIQMSLTKVQFEKNILPIYPFVVILFSHGIINFIDKIKKKFNLVVSSEGWGRGSIQVINYIFILMLTSLIFFSAIVTISFSLFQDPRLKMSKFIIENENNYQYIVPMELNFNYSAINLNKYKINNNFSIYKVLDCKVENIEKFHLIMPTSFFGLEAGSFQPPAKELADFLLLNKDKIYRSFEGWPTSVYKFSVNPGVTIIANPICTKQFFN